MLNLITYKEGQDWREASRGYYDHEEARKEAWKADIILSTYDNLQYLIDKSMSPDLDDVRKYQYKKLSYLDKEIINWMANSVWGDEDKYNERLESLVKSFEKHLSLNSLAMKNDEFRIWPH